MLTKPEIAPIEHAKKGHPENSFETIVIFLLWFTVIHPHQPVLAQF